MKQSRFSYWYFMCRACGWTWSRRQEDLPPGADVVCPRSTCKVNMKHHHKDARGIPILDNSGQPEAAIELCESADRVKAWHRKNFENTGKLHGAHTGLQEVRVPGWWFDVLKPLLGRGGCRIFYFALLLLRHSNAEGQSYVSLETLSFRMDATTDQEHPHGDRRYARRHLRFLEKIWIFWEQDGQERYAPFVLVERRGRSNCYHLVQVPSKAVNLRASGRPRAFDDQLARTRAELGLHDTDRV